MVTIVSVAAAEAEIAHPDIRMKKRTADLIMVKSIYPVIRLIRIFSSAFSLSMPLAPAVNISGSRATGSQLATLQAV